MKLQMVGVNHKTAPLEIREKFSLSREKIINSLQNIHRYRGIKEAVILGTCNRTEIYTVEEEYETKDFLIDLFDDEKIFDKYLYSLSGEDCIRHLFNVASSLDSLVIGEGQILSQVKAAYSMAKENSATSTILNTLFNRAIATGKQVRTDTKIAFNTVSISSATVELARNELNGLEGKSALIFGAGKMAQLTVQHLLAHGIKQIFIANHHFARAEELANKFSCTPVDWSNAFDVEVDLIITSTGAPHYVIKSAQVKKFKQILIIDIAVPRDVEPEVATIEGVKLYNIDDLEAVVDDHITQRKEEAESAKKIIEENVQSLVDRFKYLSVQPLMATISENAEQVRMREIHKAKSKMKLTREEEKVIEHMTKKIVRKILRMPMMNLNLSVGTTQEKFYTEAMKALFSGRQ